MTRGGGKAFVYTGPFVTGSGGPPRTLIDLSSWGTFTRSTEGSYLTGAATTGASAFMAWATANTRRLEDRGDGNGAMLLLEGSSTNYLQYSNDFVSPWVTVGGLTADYANAPDGTLVADRLQRGSASYCTYQNYATATSTVTHSSYIRATAGTSFMRRAVVGGGLALISGGFVEATASTTWQRVAFSYSELVTDSRYAICCDTRDYSGIGGSTATASDGIWTLQQAERLAFATSPIRTTGATASRGADVLSATMSQVPASMTNGGMQFDVAPIWSSSEGIAHATDKTLFSYAEDDSERIFFVVSGGSIYIRATSGGVTMVTSNALTFSAHQMLTVTVDGSAGAITVAGATTGNGTVTGTSWTRTTGPTIYIGNRQGATQPAFVRLGRYINAA